MTTTGIVNAGTVVWSSHDETVCGRPIAVKSGGTGTPLLVLPRDNGHPPKHEFLDLLASHFTVYYPCLPGFDGSAPDDWEWLANVRDLAVVIGQLIPTLTREPLSVVGLGFGGWLAAELATMDPGRFETITLVGPMGIQPRSGFMFDQFLVSTEAYARAAFADESAFEATYGVQPEFEQLERWETDREMTSRLAWKPYMYNPTLPGLLAGVETPVLIAHGEADAVVPAECAMLYRAALPNASVAMFANAGHALDLEQPAELGQAITAFIRTGAHA